MKNKYMVIVQKKGGPTISYHKSKKAARKHWRFVVANANDMISMIRVVKIIDIIQLEAPVKAYTGTWSPTMGV